MVKYLLVGEINKELEKFERRVKLAEKNARHFKDTVPTPVLRGSNYDKQGFVERCGAQLTSIANAFKDASDARSYLVLFRDEVTRLDKSLDNNETRPYPDMPTKSAVANALQTLSLLEKRVNAALDSLRATLGEVSDLSKLHAPN